MTIPENLAEAIVLSGLEVAQVELLVYEPAFNKICNELGLVPASVGSFSVQTPYGILTVRRKML